MTLFSYGVSEIRKQPLREPELLNTVINRLEWITVGLNHPIGWILHYTVGFLFIVLIEWLPASIGIDTTLFYYLATGAICGLIGIGVCTLRLTSTQTRQKFTTEIFTYR